MASDQAPTERFRDAWLPPVETPADLPSEAPPEAMCFVKSDRRVWVRIQGEWSPATPPRPPA
jgi:hypothetical protein